MKDMTSLQGRCVAHWGDWGDARNGCATVKINGAALNIVFSDGEGWDHVSVSTPRRTPSWDEMCAVKDMFFAPEDVVVQYHPRASEYRNLHTHCLHLWRYQLAEFPTPDPYLVAPEIAFSDT